MDYLFLISAIGFAAGMLGTGLGGLCTFLINNRGNKFMSFILELAAGLMLSVVCFDLLPEAFKLADIQWIIIGIILGVTIIIYIDNILRTLWLHKYLKSINNRLLKSGVLMGIGVAIHNLPEGIAIGSGFDASASLGFSLAFVIAIHNIPEGLAMSLPMRVCGLKKIRVLLYALLAGVPMGVGAFIGALLGEISDKVIAGCLGFAAGAMLYIVIGDLIPESKSIYKGRMSTIGNILGIILGIIISVWS